MRGWRQSDEPWPARACAVDTGDAVVEVALGPAASGFEIAGTGLARSSLELGADVETGPRDLERLAR